MNNRYKNLLSPIQVGGALFRNRMTATAATLHYIQGTEPYPTEKWITLIANRARNGAASVQINHMENGSPAKTGVESIDSMGAHFSMLDINDSSTHNYVCQMIDAIRYYGALAVVEPKGDLPRMGPPPGGMPGQEKSEPSGKGKPDERVQGRPDPAMPDPAMPDPAMPDPAMGGKMDFMAMERMVEEWRKTPERGGTAYSGPLHPPMCNELTKQQIKDYISSVCKNALLMKALGFDMFSFHNSYRSNLGAQFWSPRCNTRTDEYGGSVENRARFLLELFDAVKQTVGKDFPLECLISGEEDQGGNTVEDTIEFARLAEGKIDILHIRSGDIDPQHPLGYTTSRENPCPNLAAAAAVKASVAARGGKLLVGVSAGLHDPDFCEEIIASGKADFVHMARSWICDSEYGTKIYEGRGEDITPCARCNKCHVPNVSDRFRSFCTVNPQIGLEDKLDRMIKPVEKIKNVAVIGGGPGGMYAAITCAERGHKVTLFEKAPELGGQLSHTDYPSFKWPLADFKNFLANKLTRVGVEVRLNSDMTRESLAESGSYDDVIVAIGPRFVRPSNLPGAE
ncbi:MAG: NAD(P)-binding protein, partial [Clostridiales bacterium]|nr:NAD(P)-binding protein [Clostridiales bacterium]